MLFGFEDSQTASRSTWVMRSGDLSSQLARGQRPEPRQFIPREVVRGRRVRIQEKGLKRCISGACGIDQRTCCLALIRTTEERWSLALVGVLTTFYGLIEGLGLPRDPCVMSFLFHTAQP